MDVRPKRLKILISYRSFKLNSPGISLTLGNLLQLYATCRTRLNIVNCKQTKLSKWLYMLLLGEYDGGIYQHKWIYCIKQYLIYDGHPDRYDKEVVETPKTIKNQIFQTLPDLYVWEWHTSSLLKFRLSKHRLPVETGR